LAQGTRSERGEFLAGAIIRLDGDTVRGFVLSRDHVFNTVSCVFREQEGGSAITFYPSDITGYTIGGQRTFYATSPDTTGVAKFFAECVVAGKSSLYYYKDRYFIQSPTHEMTELESRKNTVIRNDKEYVVEIPLFKATLQEKMNDCAAIHETIKATALNRKSLTKLFIKYGECTGDNITVLDDDTKPKIRTGISVGVLASTLKLDSEGQSEYHYLDQEPDPTDLTLSPSFWLEISSQKRKLQFRTGITLAYGTYRVYNENVNINLSRELTISTTRLEVPVHAKFNLLNGRNALYAVGGVGLDVTIRQHDEEIVRAAHSGTILAQRSELDSNLFCVNIMGGINFEVPVGQHGVFLEAIYGWNPIFINPQPNTPTAQLSGLTFGVGFMF
jgi:hypothetical protein